MTAVSVVGADWRAALPPERGVPASTIAARVRDARRLVILDDDPTGTQSVRDVPILTSWTPDDFRWGFAQGAPGLFVLTNTRALQPDDAAARVGEVVEAALAAADQEGVAVAFASRSDSTLRGHYPLETDVIARHLAEHGRPVDAVVISPAFVDAGRVTLDGVHHLLGAHDELVPVAETDFARDATFGYATSHLAEWVQEKTAGRVAREDVHHVSLGAIRSGTAMYGDASKGEPATVVVDAVTDDDVRALAADTLHLEASGREIVYRVGPSFPRARLGQERPDPIDDRELAGLLRQGGNGLVVVGSHVPLTTRQLDALVAEHHPRVFELEVERVIGDERAAHLDSIVGRAVEALEHSLVVVRTTRALRTGADAASSLAIAAQVSAALVEATARIVRERRPAYIVAKGGITSSDVATDALEICRATVRGTLLPGIVSLWQPADGREADGAYVVFPGNVGDDGALADVVTRLERAVGRTSE